MLSAAPGFTADFARIARETQGVYAYHRARTRQSMSSTQHQGGPQPHSGITPHPKPAPKTAPQRPRTRHLARPCRRPNPAWDALRPLYSSTCTSHTLPSITRAFSAVLSRVLLPKGTLCKSPEIGAYCGLAPQPQRVRTSSIARSKRLAHTYAFQPMHASRQAHAALRNPAKLTKSAEKRDAPTCNGQNV